MVFALSCYEFLIAVSFYSDSFLNLSSALSFIRFFLSYVLATAIPVTKPRINITTIITINGPLIVRKRNFKSTSIVFCRAMMALSKNSIEIIISLNRIFNPENLNNYDC